MMMLEKSYIHFLLGTK